MNKVVVGVISKSGIDGEPSWLLVSSSKDFGEYTGFYYPPGGHLEEGETEEMALVREIKEELDLIATPITRQHISSGDIANQETYWWNCEASGEIKIGPELSDAQYFTKSQIEHELKLWPATRIFFKEHVFISAE